MQSKRKIYQMIKSSKLTTGLFLGYIPSKLLEKNFADQLWWPHINRSVNEKRNFQHKDRIDIIINFDIIVKYGMLY